MLFSRKNYS